MDICDLHGLARRLRCQVENRVLALPPGPHKVLFRKEGYEQIRVDRSDDDAQPPDAVNLSRVAALLAGVPFRVPAFTVNRLCGSGLQAIILAAQEIQLGQAEFVLAGGAENMSMAPHQIRGARWGLPLGEQKLEDYLWVALVDSYNGLGMANTAENLGRKYAIARDAAIAEPARERAGELSLFTDLARQPDDRVDSRAAAGRDVFVLVNNKAEGCAPATIRASFPSAVRTRPPCSCPR